MSETGNVSYLIENKIIFTPGTQCLTRVDHPEQQIKLKHSASLCLLLLIQHRGKVVSQNELLEFGWGSHHRQVSFNAFYQSILSLRKSLLQLDLEQTFITTIPRKGLIINEEFEILEIATSESIPLSIDIPGAPESGLTPEAGIEALLAETPHKLRVTTIETIMMVLTLIICVLIVFPWKSSDDYFSGYIAAPQVSTDCQYYFNNDASNFSRHTAFIDKNPALCQANKFIYITTYPESKKLSVLLCRSPMKGEQENACQSVYYPRYDS
ncbi:winged helix-turn-helix domain-containing protein [Citrobacter sp. Cu233]|uniref:winged helix-turn-helix domain-containing protein n=1 Tax=Citrobacter sp. Cu233 TaxID=2985160 RepID=UPI002574A23E|nr:winged helix-turn-helix domain-containing protein [Citrobacter sp. Cu233]MDM2934286.1 winged helix-turn-helix domain-containing protein [Citrobacter sp. Cu233]